MSNKIQLQANNTEYASLIEMLRGKAAGGSSEDVTDETNAYTTKISELKTAVTALENELEGKASGGSGANIETCTVKIKFGSNVTISGFQYSVFKNGSISSEYRGTANEPLTNNTEYVAENVICNSAFAAFCMAHIFSGCTTEGGIELQGRFNGGYMYCFKAPAQSGTCSIYIYDDD